MVLSSSQEWGSESAQVFLQYQVDLTSWVLTVKALSQACDM